MTFSCDRHEIARDLYLKRGANDAKHRCDINTSYGTKDLGADLVYHLALQPGYRVIDVGCGSGAHLALFQRQVGPTGCALGCDFSHQACSLAHAQGLHTMTADGAALPLRSNWADAVSCNFAIYYLNNWREAIVEWKRILKSSGCLVISGPASDTNKELYEFHRRATGHGSTDSDLMALGFVAGPVMEAMAAEGFSDLRLHTFTNPITFPDVSSFLDYWCATSMFARTQGASRVQGQITIQTDPGPLVITKTVSIAVGRKV